MFFLTPKNKLQKLILAGISLFFFAMLSTAVVRSQQRTSILGVGSEADVRDSYFVELSEVDGGGSKLYLENFRWVEVQDGRRIWEIEAKNARYFARALVAHVNDAKVLVHRASKDPMTISSDSGRLYFKANSIARAELEGEIRVSLGSEMTLEAAFAVFSVKQGEIRAPGPVRISGTGFDVTGEGMFMEIENQKVELSKNVRSQFSPDAQLPKSFDIKTLL